MTSGTEGRRPSLGDIDPSRAPDPEIVLAVVGSTPRVEILTGPGMRDRRQQRAFGAMLDGIAAGGVREVVLGPAVSARAVTRVLAAVARSGRVLGVTTERAPWTAATALALAHALRENTSLRTLSVNAHDVPSAGWRHTIGLGTQTALERLRLAGSSGGHRGHPRTM